MMESIISAASCAVLLAAVIVALRWPKQRCLGAMPTSLPVFMAILFTSGLDVGLVMLPLVDFEILTQSDAYAFSNPAAIEFGFWAFLVWGFYFMTTVYFCVIEPRLQLFEIPIIKAVNNVVIIGTCAFTTYLFLLYLPEYAQGISDLTRFSLVALVILFAVLSSTHIRYIKALSIGSVLLFLALIFGVWWQSDLGVHGFYGAVVAMSDYFYHLPRFFTPITDYHQFYLFWWFAWSIMIGQFVANFASGLRLWQLLPALLIMPSIPIAIWFAVLYGIFSQGLEIPTAWRLAMVVVGTLFVVNSLDSLIRLYTANSGWTADKIGLPRYLSANWVLLAGLVLLYQYTPLRIEWFGLTVIGLYIVTIIGLFKRRQRLVAPDVTCSVS